MHPPPIVKEWLGIYASKSRRDFPSEEILLDSLVALRFAEPCPLVAHTDFSAYIPSLGKKKKADRVALANIGELCPLYCEGLFEGPPLRFG
jgi:hypothetical protein